jgi:GTP cyclohydrolase I
MDDAVGRLTTFANDHGYDELVVARDLPVPTGVAHVAYLPGDRIVGPSELARAVERLARGEQEPERLTSRIGTWLEQQLQPRGIGVVVVAEQPGTAARGPAAHAVTTVTSSLRGQVRDDAATRAEVLAVLTSSAQPSCSVGRTRISLTATRRGRVTM